MAAPKSRINTEFYNENTIELELKGSNFNGVFIWSEWGDLNPRPLGPEPSALPAALHPVSLTIIRCRNVSVKREISLRPGGSALPEGRIH